MSRKTEARRAASKDPAGELERSELAFLKKLASPGEVQTFLDEILYSADPCYRSPRSVIRDRKAHCFDGAMFAAAALRLGGHRPLILDLRAHRDDDHVLAIFQHRGFYGAVAKSNFVGLRFREPIFRTLRELALSYFESYYNLEWEKSLRSYSKLLDLSEFDAESWTTRDEAMELVARRLDTIRHFPLATERHIRELRRVDARTYEAGMVGVNEAGIYRVEEHE
jgi:hypothetical protein